MINKRQSVGMQMSNGWQLNLPYLFTSLLLVFTLVAGAREVTQPPKDDVYSRAAEGTYTVPPELKNFRLLSSTPLKLGGAKALGYDLRQWQSDPSRVIYHDGRYHAWMIDVDYPGEYNRTVRPADGLSWILYMNSKDGKTWNAVGHVPLGPKGSCYDLGIEQANVLMHEGRFYLFSEAYTTNVEEYKRREVGIVCLVADSPEGPWKQVGGLMLRPSMDGRSFDCDKVLNPRHVFLNGKWLMYYKGVKKGQPTDNGVAIADSLAGPYTKYEKNPLLHGHGHFAWRYKHGVIMLMFDAAYEKNYSRLLWTEDGIHFVPLAESEDMFLFGSLYCPNDPLCGKPVTDKPATKYWGLQSVYHRGTTGWDVERIEWQFGGTEGSGAGGEAPPEPSVISRQLSRRFSRRTKLSVGEHGMSVATTLSKRGEKLSAPQPELEYLPRPTGQHGRIRLRPRRRSAAGFDAGLPDEEHLAGTQEGGRAVEHHKSNIFIADLTQLECN